MDVSAPDSGMLAFGQFRLDRRRRMLLRGGAPVKLTPKAFDTLLYLVTHAGRVVDKDELVAAVWGGRIVEEGNLTHTIFSIRKVLRDEAGGDRWIVTAPGRGYRFTAEVFHDVGEDMADLGGCAPPAADGITAPLPADGALLRRHRLLVGAGACALAAFAGAGIWYSAWRPAAGPSAAETVAFAPPPRSIAVLDFANMSGDPKQDYFSDGLADELINTLTRINTLRVAARTSAFSFKDSHATIGDIARRLNVGAVLEGSVWRDGAQVRVNVQLVNSVTGFPFWSRTYDRNLSNVLGSQAEIAHAVADSLRLTLLGDDTPRLVSGGTRNPQALDAYLQGRSRLRDEDDKGALTAFETAIGLDGRYALARVARADTLRDIVNQDIGDAHEASRLEEEAIAEAERAVALAPDLGAAHRALGAVLEEGRFDFAGAAREYARARDLAPGDAAVNQNYAELQSHLGHADEAIAASEFAVTLNPLSPREYMSLSGNLALARRYDAALDAARHAVVLRGHASTYDRYTIGEIELLQGHADAARKTCDGGADWPLMHCEALAYGKLGRMKEAMDAAAKLRATLGDAGAMQYVMMYAQWGQPDQAIAWLQTAYRLRDTGLIELKALPLLDPIRNRPEYKDIETRMNFPA